MISREYDRIARTAEKIMELGNMTFLGLAAVQTLSNRPNIAVAAAGSLFLIIAYLLAQRMMKRR